MIQVIGSQLSQWDVGRSVSVSDSNATHVHFANQGDSKAVIIEIVSGSAKIPNYLLQTGRTLLAYAVLDGVTLEIKPFYVRKRERPENYVYDDDRRNYIYELITDALAATAAANLAADNASDAATNAEAAATSATEAAENANLATKSANEAAHIAKNFMVVGDASGTNISLDDSAKQFFVGLRIFGKTTQDGTPTPEAPVELVSVGDGGSVTVNVTGESDAQSMTIAAPNGLPGIRVTSGGNYTDADGQEWICDEVDLTRGVYVQRVYHGPASAFGSGGYGEIGSYTRIALETPTQKPSIATPNGLSNIMPMIGNYSADQLHFYAQNKQMWVFVPIDELQERTTASVLAWLTSKGAEFQYILATPIETPLSDEELAAYADLQTYRGNTTIYNDAGAWMELEYVMDAKKYIDNLVGSGGSGGAAPARLADVTLLASAWNGSNSLYSQVVEVEGVTEHSQVDLTPSVEQLAVFYEKDLTFVTENEGGVVTVYAIGQKPTNDYTIQVTITEVSV